VTVKTAKGLRRVTVGLGLAMVGLFGMVSMASAISGTMSGGAFQAACVAIDGEYALGAGFRTCTVTVEGGESEVETKPAGESERGWNAIVTTTDTVTVYRWTSAATAVSSNTTGGDSEITGCTNPGGQEMDPEHENCQLP